MIANPSRVLSFSMSVYICAIGRVGDRRAAQGFSIGAAGNTCVILTIEQLGALS